MKNRIQSLLTIDKNSKRNGIISALIWALGVAAVIIISEISIYQSYAGSPPSVVAIDPLSIGFILCAVLALVVFLPLICYSYHHLQSTDSPFLIKTVKLWRTTNLLFVALALFGILAEIAKRFGFV